MASSIGGLGGGNPIQGPGQGDKPQKKGILKTSGGSHEITAGKDKGKSGDSAAKVSKHVHFTEDTRGGGTGPQVAPRPSAEAMAKFKGSLGETTSKPHPQVPPRPSAEAMAKFKGSLGETTSKSRPQVPPRPTPDSKAEFQSKVAGAGKSTSSWKEKLGNLLDSTVKAMKNAKEILKKGIARTDQAIGTGLGKIKEGAVKGGVKVKEAANEVEVKVNKDGIKKMLSTLKQSMTDVGKKMQRLVGKSHAESSYWKSVINQREELNKVDQMVDQHAVQSDKHTVEEQKQLAEILVEMNSRWEAFKKLN